MMTSQNGGQLVLQPQTSAAVSSNQTSGQQQVRLQGIKVISVPSNGPRVLVPQQGQPMVARILTRPGLPSLQPVILAPSVTSSGAQPQVVQQVPQPPQQLVSLQPQVQPAISKQVAQPNP